MQLQSVVTPAKPAVPQMVSYEGQEGNVEVAYGQVFRVETSPNGGELLSSGPPEGKRWVVYHKVAIQEFDV